MGAGKNTLTEGLKEVAVQRGHKVTVFNLPEQLELVKCVGGGAYGTVAAFKDAEAGETIAIKKVTRAFDDLVDGKRILREIKLLQQLHHDNIIRIRDIYPPQSPDFEDIYIVTDLMDTDLQSVINSRQALTEDHHQHFTYQMLRGLAYLHSKEVVHRDLKPPNILVNRNCDVRICDFGLARVLKAADEDTFGNTDYVVTRWYRAPEVVLLASEYTQAIDVWAVGCILAEMLQRKAFFPGKDYCDQIKKIVTKLGTPTEQEISWIPHSSPARTLLSRFPITPKIDWARTFPNGSPKAHAALEVMLRFNPSTRCGAAEAMRMEYFENDQLAEDFEDLQPNPVDWSFDNFEPTKPLLQSYVYRECVNFHPEIVARDAQLLRERGMEKLLTEVAILDEDQRVSI